MVLNQKYIVSEYIASGSQASIYKVIDKDSKMIYALKLFDLVRTEKKKKINRIFKPMSKFY